MSSVPASIELSLFFFSKFLGLGEVISQINYCNHVWLRLNIGFDYMFPYGVLSSEGK